MAAFTNWDWVTSGADRYISACSNKNPHNGTTWATIAEIRYDAPNQQYVAISYFPEWTIVRIAGDSKQLLTIEAVEAYLRDKGVID